MQPTNYSAIYVAYMRIGHLPTSAFLRDGLAEAPYDKDDPMQQLAQAVNHAREVIAVATTVFPFTLFPDTITIDREKVTVAHRYFFRVAEVISIRIEDVLNVAADTGPIFGSLKITSRFFDARKPYHVNYLWRHDAERIKRILQGYIIAGKKKIDCSKMSLSQLRLALEQLGHTPPELDE